MQSIKLFVKPNFIKYACALLADREADGMEDRGEKRDANRKGTFTNATSVDDSHWHCKRFVFSFLYFYKLENSVHVFLLFNNESMEFM